MEPIIYSPEHFAVEKSVLMRMLEKDSDMPKEYLRSQIAAYVCSVNVEKGRAYTVEQLRELFALAEMGRNSDGIFE